MHVLRTTTNVNSRMGTVTQRHKGEQSPAVLGRWINPFICAKPRLDFGTSRVVKANHRHEGREASIARHL